MIQGKDILYFASDDWATGVKSGSVQIALTLAKANRVLYINLTGPHLTPFISIQAMRQIYTRFSRYAAGLNQVAPNLWTLTPLTLPVQSSPLIWKINAIWLGLYLKQILKKLEMKRPLFWSLLPQTVHLIGKFNESGVIYCCVNEYSQVNRVPIETLRQQQKQMIRKSDYIFAASKELYQLHKNSKKHFYYLPPGVDIQHFRQAQHPDLAVPAAIQGIPPPIIGFYGIFGQWIDCELLFQAAYQNPQWSFVFLGKIEVNVSQLKLLKNIHFLGPQAFADIPKFARMFDVAIIPFVLNEYTRFVNPVKLREYLIAGLPVVSTRFPAVEQLKNLVYLADDTSDFIRKIGRALAENGPVAPAKRIKYIEKESWQSRMEQISQIIINGGYKI